MATIEERAKEYILHCSTAPANRVGRLQGYIKGAAEQKQIDIDRVCEWLETHLPYYCDEFDESYTAEAISDLREEMAKEE